MFFFISFRVVIVHTRSFSNLREKNPTCFPTPPLRPVRHDDVSACRSAPLGSALSSRFSTSNNFRSSPPWGGHLIVFVTKTYASFRCRVSVFARARMYYAHILVHNNVAISHLCTRASTRFPTNIIFFLRFYRYDIVFVHARTYSVVTTCTRIFPQFSRYVRRFSIERRFGVKYRRLSSVSWQRTRKTYLENPSSGYYLFRRIMVGNCVTVTNEFDCNGVGRLWVPQMYTLLLCKKKLFSKNNIVV